MKQILTLTDDVYANLVNDDNWLNAIAHPVTCLDRYGKFEHLRTCSYPVEYIVSEAQMKDALGREEVRKKEILDGITAGELVFVGMGADIKDAGYPGGVGNHRVRCNFRNDAGDTFFIEFLCGNDNGKGAFFVDSAMDYAKDKEYNRQWLEAVEWNRNYIDIRKHKPMPKQFQYNPFGVANARIEKTFSFDNVLEFINTKFGCSYTSSRLVPVYLVDYKSFVNTCKIN